MVRINSPGFIRSTLLLAVMLLMLLFLAWPGSAQAVMLKINEEELINDAELIVTGVVNGIHSYWNDQQNFIYSDVTIKVNTALGNDAFNYDEITVVVPGGEVGDIGQDDSLSPTFYVGQEVLLYLQPFVGELHSAMVFPDQQGKKLYSVYGNFQGKKDIVAGKINNIPIDIYKEQIINIQKGETELFLSGSKKDDQILVSRSSYELNGRQWPASSIPVNYRVNTTGGPIGSLIAIQNASAVWSNAGANFGFSYTGSHNSNDGNIYNGVNEVSFYNSSGSELGIAQWWYYTSTGNIVEADFYFNTSYSFTTIGTPPTGSPFDVQTVATHEFGHCLGLGHSANNSAIMYFEYQGIRRNLHSDDIAGIRAIYGSSAVAHTLNVNSTNPTLGVAITSSTGHGGTTAYTRSIGQGTSVTLTAPQYHGSGAARKRFSNWSGAVSSTNRTITLSMSANRTVTANYVNDPESTAPLFLDAEITEANFPANVAPGQSFSGTVTVRNTGNQSWTRAEHHRLGITGTSIRAFLPADVTIAPGQSHTFTISHSAPTTPGIFNFNVRMAREGGWFGQSRSVSITVSATVTPPLFLDAEITEANFPANVAPGQSFTGSVTVRNTGTQSWTRAEHHRLGITGTSIRAFLPADVTIAPGQSHTFTISHSAPTTPGIFNFNVRMAREGGWFGQSRSVSINVGWMMVRPN